MSIISALQEYIKDYASLETDAPVWVDYLGASPTEYSVSPLPGAKIIETYINGGTIREYPFSFQMVGSTADDLARLDNLGFYEAFSEWLDQQTLDGIFPTLDAGQTPIEISANGWGYLFEQGQSDSGIYQIAAKITYEQAPGTVTPSGD